ncbi:hypothetical protein DFP73DRAFT_532605 [Morchella snyderi]|nr:hypothetical protein DFP73DRAFT_532605 [Morchella snyderi]
MVVLNFGDWIRRSLLLIFIFLQIVSASTLITLAKATCLQRCFISTCPDLGAKCVCKSLLDAKIASQSSLCSNDSCGEEISYLSLAQECSRYLPTSSLTTLTTTSTGSTATPNTSTISSTVVATTTAPYPTELERSPISTSVSLTTDASGPQTSSGSQANTQSTRGPSLRQRALTAVFVLAPVSIVLMLVAIFVVIRRRKQARRSITSFAGVKGWNRSPMALAEPAPVRRDVEQQFPPRVADQVRGGRFSLFPKPPTFPPQVRRPPMITTTMEPKKVLPEVPPMSQHRPITRISEVSETVSPTRDIGTFQTMDSELQRAFLEVRQGFRSDSTRSSTRTSMDWSMMIDISQSSNTGSRRDSEFSSKAGSKTDTRFSWQ